MPRQSKKKSAACEQNLSYSTPEQYRKRFRDEYRAFFENLCSELTSCLPSGAESVSVSCNGIRKKCRDIMMLRLLERFIPDHRLNSDYHRDCIRELSEIAGLELAEHSESFPAQIIEQVDAFLAGFRYDMDEYVIDECVVPENAFSGCAKEIPTCRENVITPSSLADVFENMLEDNSVLGTYYTPEPVVEYMCRESLLSWLQSTCDAKDCERIHSFIVDRNVQIIKENPELRATLVDKLNHVQILDPAVGAGAFVVGMMHALCSYLALLEPDRTVADIRNTVLTHCLFAVDIDSSALEITRLRLCFLLNNGLEQWYPLPCGNHIVCDNALMMNELLVPPQFYSENGFDIVIANPPYGVKMTGNDKKYYKTHYSWLEKKFDIYMVFLSLGIKMSRNTVCYITPDKWLSKVFGLVFRENAMMPYLSNILHLGNAVFEKALVDSIVTVFQKKGSDFIQFRISDKNNHFYDVQYVEKSNLKSPWFIDTYFQAEIPEIISKIEKQNYKLSDYVKCEYAMVSPVDAYDLKNMIVENETPSGDEVRIINTGLIGKYRDKWQSCKMTYLKGKYTHPVVHKNELLQRFGEGVVQRVTSPKLIIKGLNLLDACIDETGSVMSTVATLNIRSHRIDLLMVIAGIINARIITDYYKAKYLSSSYCGGLLFTPQMIGDLPVPDLSDLSNWQDVVDAVGALFREKSTAASMAQMRRQIDELVSRHYDFDEIE